MTIEADFAESPIKIGNVYRFDYPHEFTTLPEYSAHRGASVIVLRPDPDADVLWDDLGDGRGERIVDRMFVVQSEDGWIGHAWESELENIS